MYTAEMRSHVFTPYRMMLLAFTLIYSIGFYALFVTRGNSEFIWYLLQLFAFIALACTILWHVPEFPNWLLTLVVIMGLMHVAGGGVLVGDHVLYAAKIYPFYVGTPAEFYILKYDQLVHMLGFGVVALAFRYLLLRHARGLGVIVRSFYASMIAIGLSALNEVSEFVAVIVFVRTFVGGYYNVVLDLTFNIIGAIGAVVILELIVHWQKWAQSSSIETTPP